MVALVKLAQRVAVARSAKPKKLGVFNLHDARSMPTTLDARRGSIFELSRGVPLPGAASVRGSPGPAYADIDDDRDREGGCALHAVPGEVGQPVDLPFGAFEKKLVVNL